MKIVPAAGSIRRRLFWIVGGVSLGCLLVVNLVWLPGTIREIREAQEDLRRFAVRSARDQIGQFLAGKVHALTSVTLLFRGPYLDGERDELRLLAQRFLQREPAFEEVGIVRPEGKEILRISRRLAVTGQDLRDRSDLAIFQEGRRRPYWGAVEITETSEPWVTVGVPFKRSEGGPAGVVYGVLNLKSLWQLTEEFKLGSEGRAYVVDGMGRLIASNDPSLVLKQMAFADRDIVKRLIGQRAGSGSAFVHDAYVNELAVKVAATGVLLEEVRWGVVVEQRQALLYAPVRQKILFSLGFSVIGLVVSFGLAHLLSRRLSGPIIRLREGVAQIGLGRLEHQVEIETRDEIGDLARQFNQMADQLRASHQDLERKVSDATRDLDRRRREAEALAQVARSLTENLDVSAVGERIVGSVLPLFAVRSSVLRLLEPDGSLRAVAFGGQALPRDSGGDVLPSGIGVTGRAVAEGRPVWSPDLLAERGMSLTDQMRGHLVRSENRAMIAVPLRTHDKTIGSLELSDRAGRFFSEAEVTLLQTFADQAALALDNARLYGETQRRLRETQALLEISQSFSSTLELTPLLKVIAQRTARAIGADRCSISLFKDGYVSPVMSQFADGHTDRTVWEKYKELGRRKIEDIPAWVRAVERRSPVIVENAVASDLAPTYWHGLFGINSVLSLPLMGRDEVVGILTLEYLTDLHKFTDEEISLAATIASPVALAIDNARLYEETTRRRAEAEALARTASRLTEQLDIPAVGARIAESALTLVAARRAGVWLLQPDSSLLAIASAGDGYHNLPGAVLAPGTGVAGRVVTEGKPVWSSDVMREGLLPDDVQRALNPSGDTAVLGVPLHTEGKINGALIIVDQAGRSYSDHEVVLLQTFAAQAGLALGQAKLHEETERRRREAEGLAQVARSLTESLDVTAVGERIVASVLPLFGVRSSTLRLLDPDGSLRAIAFGGQALPSASGGDILRPGAGITGRSVVEGRSVWSSDVLGESEVVLTDEMRDHVVRSGSRAMIAVPLRAHDKIIGSLGLSDRTGRLFTEAEVSLLQTFADQAALALENARLYEETERRAVEVSTLHEIGTKLVSTLDLSAVLEKIAESAIQLIGGPRCAVFELDPRDQRLQARATKGMRPDQPFIPMKLGQGAAGSAVLKREPVFSPDVHAQPLPMYDEVWEEAGTTLREVVQRRGYRAILAVPLVSRETVLGAICIYWDDIHAYDEREAQLLTALAQQAAVAIENARLYEETEQRRREAEELTRVARLLTERLDVQAVAERIVEGVRKLLKVAEGTVFRLQADGSLAAVALRSRDGDSREVGYVLPPGAGVAGRAVMRGEPVCCVDILRDSEIVQTEIHPSLAAGGVRALLAIPLRSKGQIIGALGVGDQAGRTYTDGDISLLQAFGAQAALALENAQLYEETERRRHEAEELAQVARTLTESLKSESVATRIVEGVRWLLSVAEATVYRLEPDRSLLALAVSDRAGDLTQPGFVIPAGAGASGRAVETGGPVYSADVLRDPGIVLAEIHQRLATASSRAVLAIPLRSKGEIIGTLSVADEVGRTFTEAEVSLIQSFADQAALALENAQLYERVNRSNAELGRLYEMARDAISTSDTDELFSRTLRSAAELLECRSSSIRLLDPETDILRVVGNYNLDEEFSRRGEIRIGEGRVGRIVLDGEPLTIGDLETEPSFIHREEALKAGIRSVAIVPLRAQALIIGVLGVYGVRPRRFSDDEISSLMEFANLVTLVIERNRLLHETQARAAKLNALIDVGKAVGSSLDLEEVFGVIVRSMRALLSADVSRLWVFDSREGVLRLRGVTGDAESTPFPQNEFHSGEGFVGSTFESREPVILSNPQGDSSYSGRDWAIQARINMIVGVPILLGDRALGAITAAFHDPKPISREDLSLARAFASQAAISIENARLYADATRRRREAEELAEVARTLTESLDLKAVAERIVEGVRRLLDVRDATVYQLQDERALLALAVGGGSEFRKAGFILPVGTGAAGQAVASGEPVFSPDILHDPKIVLAEIHQALEPLGDRSVLAVPLRSKGQIIGALSVSGQVGRLFTEAETSLLQTFGDQAALAMENARLYEETKRGRREAEELAQVARTLTESLELQAVATGIAEGVRELLNVAEATVFQLQPDRSLLALAVGGHPGDFSEPGFVIPPGAGVSGRAVATGEPVFSADLLHDPEVVLADVHQRLTPGPGRAVLATPLHSKGKIIGVLTVSDEVGRVFTDDEVALVRAFADQGALAMENARLYADATRRQREAESLAEVGRLISKSLNPQEVQQQIAESVRAFFRFRNAVLFRLEPETEDLVAVALSGEFDRFLPEMASQVGLSNPSEVGSARREGFYTLPKGIGIGGLAVRERSVVTTENVLADPRIKLTPQARRAFERQSVRSGLSAPLIVKDRIIGAISFGDVESRTFTAEEIQLVQAFANQAALALENARLYADATRRQREAESLAEVGRLISKSLDPGEVQQQIVDSVRALFHSQASDLFRLDPESHALHMRALSGDFGDLDQTLAIPAGVGLPGLAVIERRPMTSPDILHDRRIPFHRETRDNYARAPFRSALCVPLVVKEQVVGVLGIGDRPGRVFTEEEMRLAQAFADQAALAMENARLFEETKERSKELAISYAAASTFNRPVDLKTRLDAVLDNVADYFNAQAASLRLFDEEGERLQYVAARGWPEELGNRLIGARGLGAVAEHVVTTGEPLISNDLTQDPLFREGRLPQFGFRSAIYVPIRIKEKVVGILDLLSPTPGRFDDEDKAILSSLCNQIGVALESAWLQEETQRRAQEQATLNAIATAMTQSLEVKELLEIAIDKVLEVTERDRVSIRLKDPVTGAVTLVAHRGFSKEEIEILDHRTQHEIVNQVSSSGQPTVINDQKDDNRLPLLPHSRSVAWIPLKARGRGVGVLGISASWPKPFSSREVDLLQAIGNVIGVGLENVRLYEETRQRLQETSTLLAVSQATGSSLDSAEVLRLLARETCRSLGADMVGAYLADPDGSVLRPVAGYHVPKHLIQAFQNQPIPMRDHEFLAEGWEKKGPVFTTDSASDPRIDQGWFGRFPHRSLLFIPMMIRDERTGGIFAVWWDKAPRFTQETLRLVEGIGRQAAIAVENARLFEESRRLVAELKAMTHELGVKNKELDTFVYTVSHDLKAPLVTLQGMAELLLEGHGSAIDEKGQHYLRRLKANAQQMERLILDLLALSRIGREGRSAVAVPLGEVVEDLLLEWGETIKTRGINVACHDLPTLWGVRTQIEQIMSNLVGNAIKYLGEPQEPSIELGAKDDGGPMVECYVRDNGIGIDPAYHEKVFEIFQRLKDTEVEGTGVGLAIVKKIVDGAGGRIWVESARGQGATFRFTWPKAKVEDA